MISTENLKELIFHVSSIFWDIDATPDYCMGWLYSSP